MEQRHTVLGVSVAAFAATMLARLVISPVVTEIIVDFRVGTPAVGLALSGMWGAYALMQFPSGVLGERYGERAVVLAALGLTAVGSLLVAVAPTFLAFAAVVLALGAGAGLYFSPATSMLTRRFEETGAALSVHSAGASIGGLAAPVVAAAVAVRYGWRAAVATGAVAATAILVVVALRVPRTAPTHPDAALRDRVSVPVLGALLTRPGVAFTTLLAVTTVFAWQAVASFLPTFLEEYRGLSTARAGLAFGAVFVVSTVALPVVGRLSDRLSRDTVLAGTLLTAASGLVVVVVVPGLLGLVAGVLAVGVGVSWGGVVQSRFMDRFDPDEQGTGFGLVRTVYMLVGATGSAVTGTLAGLGGWPLAFGAVAGLLGLGAAAIATNRALDLGL